MWTETEVQKPRAPPDDPVLLERFREGDPAAFDAIVSRHRQMLYGVALRLLGNHHDADEAAQSALLRAWQGRARFRGEARVSTWLTRIVLNVARSMRRGAAPAGSLEEVAELQDPRSPADARVGAAQSRVRVRDAVDTLPPRQREVVLLKVFSEMTHREVAQALELTEGAVKAHLHQAIGNLRRALRRSGDEG